MTRFRPTVESLDARALPSAVVPSVPDAEPSALAAESSDRPDQPVAEEQTPQSLNFTKITYSTLQAAGKVTVQDFHFKKTVDKASTGL